MSAARRITTAEILAVGSEMLTPFRLDTNSLFITERLNDVGVRVRAKTVIGDSHDDLADVFGTALRRSDLVVLTGGLGPTEDDLTRDVVAEVLGLPLEEHEEIVERIRARFKARGIRMPDINRRQAMVPRGAARLDNANGTAPGLWIETPSGVVVLLPGPPREMKPMFEAVVRDRLAPLTGSAQVFRRVLKITGRSESFVDEAAHPVYSRWAEGPEAIATTILAVLGQIELHLSTRDGSREKAEARLSDLTAELQAALGPVVYSTDGRTLEEVVGAALTARGLWIATAESCTGGLLGSRLTDVPGSSTYLDRGVICYSNRAKTDLVGVPAATISEHGAVSEPVAAAMARGIRERAGVHIGVGVTGIAGPSGGTAAKPVGTVVVAVAWDGGERVKRYQFTGHREMVKFQAATAALDMVRRWLLGVPEDDRRP